MHLGRKVEGGSSLIAMHSGERKGVGMALDDALDMVENETETSCSQTRLCRDLIPRFVCTNSLRLRPPSAIGPYRTCATQESRGAPKNATEKGHRSSPCIKGACHIISRSATTASLIPRLIGGYAGKLQTARGPSRQMNSRYGGVSGEERPNDSDYDWQNWGLGNLL
jgi:hypothetical protein